ncbi:uncharacterized protein LOC127122436 [Lathyrus oleraceus]|uniref:uncharacterized protein LOC127122436 n=1 Tax=Pisum sativum TaxID=3888 RepID=UPI0021D2FEC3|nr:uncharacterized protein LOC127122436 [Pisum sativum]
MKTGMYEVNGIDHVNAKMDALTQKTENLNITPTAGIAVVAPNSELCGTTGGKKLDGPVNPRLQNPIVYQKSSKATKTVTTDDQPEEQKDKGEENKKEDAVEKEKPYMPPLPYKPPIPYPQRLAKSKNEGKFKKFLLKDILSNKNKFEDNETVTLTMELRAVIQNNMPPKLKDRGSISIPCLIGNFVIDKALCDLGANVSLVPLSICEKLKLGEVRPTRMSLPLADCFVKFSVSMLENIPVHIGQFYIPTDFIIMDIKEDSNIHITLGRPFLATAEAIIDVKKGKLTFEVKEEKVEFIISHFLKAPTIEYSCCFLEVIEEFIREMEME